MTSEQIKADMKAATEAPERNTGGAGQVPGAGAYVGSIRWREDADSQDEARQGGSPEEGGQARADGPADQGAGRTGGRHTGGGVSLASDDLDEEERLHRFLGGGPRRPITRSRSRLSAVPLVSESGELSEVLLTAQTEQN